MNVSPPEVIHMQITFDSMIFSASFLNDGDADDWVQRMVTQLLDQYTFTMASRFEIRRTG